MPVASASASTTATATSPASAATAPQQHGIDYYRNTAEDDAAILDQKRAREFDERQRKKEHKKFTKQHGHWQPHQPLAPHRYSNLKAYKASGGWVERNREFRAYLRRVHTGYEVNEVSEAREASGTTQAVSTASPHPPAAAVKRPSFAPPASYDPPAAEQSGEVAYARRMHLSQQHAPSPAESSVANPPPAPSVMDEVSVMDEDPVMDQVAVMGQVSVVDEPSVVHEAPVADEVPPPPPPGAYPSPPPPPTDTPPVLVAPSWWANSAGYANATISAPPVRFERPDVPMKDADAPAKEDRPTKRHKTNKAEPKMSKAEAMMAKMGYVKGQGLGAKGDGVVTHLEVKMRKSARGGSTLDDEGGKVKSQQVWDVHGGLRNQKDEPGKFGEESSVVVAWGCLDGIDWNENSERNDGGIRQDMGEAFSAKVSVHAMLILQH
jgi:splicing factor 45